MERWRVMGGEVESDGWSIDICMHSTGSSQYTFIYM